MRHEARVFPGQPFMALMISGARPALPRTSRFLRPYIARRASLAGPRYFLGSNSSGFREKTSRIFAVMTSLPSESILILQTTERAASRSCSSGIPEESFQAAAATVDRLHGILRDGGRAVQDNWETRDPSFDFMENVEADISLDKTVFSS